ncbi:glycosyltransferase [Micromonospora sp. NBC_01796]|uniref:glycosyltransferase n=1 Tax=Micromonospora sp. NBC_01796 TaxID=2975987 RepID=UPI002DDAD969|nr:nucleotide disphospho-sugar-binding domain-containing protein [Micromonospora sp. NBC_01796]WSA84215.1 glycosyltransferase [Micromonospora sp. NBC_01796]
MALVLMVVHGTDGDVLPFVAVGRQLLARGHDVTILTHAYYRNAVRAAGALFVAVDTLAQYEAHLADAAVQQHSQDINDFREHFDRTGLADQLRFECAELIRRHRPGDTVLVGAPLTAHSVLVAGEVTGAPVVCLAQSPFQLMKVPGVAWLYEQVLADRIDAARAVHGLVPVRDWTAWMWSADAYIGLWPDWFDRAGDPAPPGTLLTGFVLGDDDQPVRLPPQAEELLRADVPPLLVTGGTGRLLQPDFYRCATAALARLRRPALLVVRHRDLVPEVLPPGTHWFPHLPFRALVSRVAAVVHHGGIGTVARALAARTPQVLLADGMDRPDNAARLAASGLGRALAHGRWTPSAVVEEVRAVLERPPAPPPPAGDGAVRAAEAVETVLTGSFTR